jgi:hypothetical protein
MRESQLGLRSSNDIFAFSPSRSLAVLVSGANALFQIQAGARQQDAIDNRCGKNHVAKRANRNTGYILNRVVHTV